MCLTVVPRPRDRRDFTPCSNRCAESRFGGAKMGTAKASHNAVILGHDVPLCRRCALAWPRMWDEALELEPVAA